MLLLNRKLYAHVKFARKKKDLNDSGAKILDQQQKNLSSKLGDGP